MRREGETEKIIGMNTGRKEGGEMQEGWKERRRKGRMREGQRGRMREGSRG